MFTGKEDMEATALREQGWSISAIARHLGRSRETVRKHLDGTRTAGERRRSEPDGFEPFVAYLRERLGEDPHVWATALYDEVTALGFPLSYQSFTRGLRSRSLRPHCEACSGVKGRATIEIEHPPGEEIQWDWDDLPEAPWGDEAHLLLGSLPCSGKFRGVFADSEDQPHLIEALDEVLRRLGGTARRWRTDRMSTVVDPKTGVIQPSFVPVAKHYGVSVIACPPRRGNRKGSVEKSIHFATQRFWRTMTAETMARAQAQLDRFCERIADRRPARSPSWRSSSARTPLQRSSQDVSDGARPWRTWLGSRGSVPFLARATRQRSRPRTWSARPASSPSRATPTRSIPDSLVPR